MQFVVTPHITTSSKQNSKTACRNRSFSGPAFPAGLQTPFYNYYAGAGENVGFCRRGILPRFRGPAQPTCAACR